MCAWVIAMNKYAEVYKDIEPKIKKRDAAEMELKQVLTFLKQKQNQLAEVEAKIQILKDDLDKKQKDMQDIQNRYDLNSVRLNRAGRLTSALSDEEVRWRGTVDSLNQELFTVPGDVLVASACIAYLGAFSIDYRKRMSSEWILECQRLNIPSTSTFDLVHCLGDHKIREWNMDGLPHDEVSLENGIIVTQASRWPLMIDPQEQANQWIRNMEKDNNLVITKMTDPHLMRVLEMAIRKGLPVLLEELGETIEPSLQPVLARSIFTQGGRTMIRFGDVDIDFDSNFKLYMTTKLANPHYLPEICIQVTMVNFLVSIKGLEDQLLTDIVRIELPDMEKQRNDLIVSINEDKQQLLSLEDKILKLLSLSQGNILDDEELVETLNESRETSIVVGARLVEAEKMEEMTTYEREKYRSLAAKGAVLFFVVTSLAEIDPMYQFSLRYFSHIFCSVIETEHAQMESEERLAFLMQEVVKEIYSSVGRGLFERHKLIFSFLLATAIEKNEGRLQAGEVDFLLKGVNDATTNLKLKPEVLGKLSDQQWASCIYLERRYSDFDKLSTMLTERIEICFGDFAQEIALTSDPKPSSKDWSNLSPFKKLMLISVLKSDVLVNAISSFIRLTLGSDFTDSKHSTLARVFEDTSATVPLIFVLSTGSDPMAALQKFAQEKDFIAKLHSVSLGQGQGPVAEGLISKARLMGNWVFLQNCHLATSWMPQMETIVRSFSLGEVKVHPDFRLFLSSMPSDTFPVSVLQNSVKLTNEPPRGLRANLMRSLSDLEEEQFEVHILGEDWRKMVFGICVFHGVVLERRKFGSLGFNTLYEFSESDRECALRTFNIFLDREKKKSIPWQALEYINGEITYGGRVTDEWDQRCLRTILKNYSSERILQENFTYSESGVYRCPEGRSLVDFKNYIEDLPLTELPEVFGMHQNANIIYQSKETQFFIQTMLEGQPKASSEIISETNHDEIALDMILRIKKLLAKSISTENIDSNLTRLDDKGRPAPLTTVLLQEVERFNKLLKIIHSSLSELEKAIKGIVVMSEGLEAVYDAFFVNQVPAVWSQKGGFLSTKSLANWIKDFAMRIEFIESWTNRGMPRSFWISGLFFPQSFLTGVLQTFARKHNQPIDFLRFDFQVMETTLSQKMIQEQRIKGVLDNTDLFQGLEHPEDGVFVHGLFIEAGKWDSSRGGLCDPEVGEIFPCLPVLWLKPVLDSELAVGSRYEAPLYKTPVRAGVLSTTGHSTNFVLSVLLESEKPQEFWILRGTALVTLITE